MPGGHEGVGSAPSPSGGGYGGGGEGIYGGGSGGVGGYGASGGGSGGVGGYGASGGYGGSGSGGGREDDGHDGGGRGANMNHEVTLSTGPRSYTVFGYEDYNLQCTREHYQKKGIGIVIREESELKLMRKENQRKHRAKEKGKEKENQAPNLHVSWDDIAIEWKRVHSTTSRGWRKVNRVFVTNNICWPWTLPMNSLSFQRFMYRRHGRA